MKPFSYNTITTGSNFAPLTLELKDGRTGYPVDFTGATVTVTVRDEQTGETIVENAAGAVSSVNPAWVEFFFADVDVAKIDRESVWLVEWTVTSASMRIHRTPVPCRLPVRPRL